MLTSNELESFFTKYNVPLQSEVIIPLNDVHSLMLAADKIGRSFAGFIKYSVINSEGTGYFTHFDSIDVLYECYCHFMTGWHLKANMNNN